MKYLFSLLILTVCSTVMHSQGLPNKTGGTYETSATEGNKIEFSDKAELKSDIADVASSVAYKLMRCCSSYGGNNIQGTVNWNECYYNKLRNTYSAVVTVSWTGSLSGTAYWVKGKLKLKYTAGNDGTVSETRAWEKIADSGGFSAGCGQSCSIDE